MHPRVSDTQPITSMLEMILRDSCSELSKVGSVQPDCPVCVPSGGRSPYPKSRAREHPTGGL